MVSKAKLERSLSLVINITNATVWPRPTSITATYAVCGLTSLAVRGAGARTVWTVISLSASYIQNCQLLYYTFFKHWAMLTMNKMTLINWLTIITEISSESILTTTYPSSINGMTINVIQTMSWTRFVTPNSIISRKAFWKSIYLWSNFFSVNPLFIIHPIISKCYNWRNKIYKIYTVTSCV